jgi:hypothetical protein
LIWLENKFAGQLQADFMAYIAEKHPYLLSLYQKYIPTQPPLMDTLGHRTACLPLRKTSWNICETMSALRAFDAPRPFVKFSITQKSKSRPKKQTVKGGELHA